MIDPDNGAYIDSMGWLYYQVGEYAVALTYLERAVLLLPGDPAVYEHLGDVYFKLNDEEQAAAYWEKARQAGADEAMIQEKLEQLN